ncbi:MAG: 1,4-alpha-glucan branching protein GlgB [Caldicoprobacterales bacterium]|jgi:1,4-alpha-glucan branching enzyme|nr:1,4-alpha-glucan branching protein GlgB [Clostridiales bacterium]
MDQKKATTPRPTDYQIYLFHEGTNYKAYDMLGSIYFSDDSHQKDGFRFTLWAPNAVSVSLVGDFNQWRLNAHPMQKIEDSGIWMVFIEGMKVGERYKYAITSTDGEIQLKADPFAYCAELRPNTGSITYRLDTYQWKHSFKRGSPTQLPQHSPMLIYEVHAGSWRRHEDGSFYTYRELAKELIPYVLDMGYTHIELMPLQEHPLDASWGYQVTGYYAATSRYGKPEDLMFFIDACHEAGLKVIMDWVPAHFPKDAHGLARFDGTHLFEYEDPRLGAHPQWGTLVFDYSKPEVQSFLISNALFWLNEYHFDGLRVDAVTSMLYRDYARNPGEWLPNIRGGRENLEAVAFLQKLNKAVFAQHPHALMIAEESTAFPGVTRPVHEGGLGFNYKWNMGWMHDSLQYFSLDPLFRKFHHNLLTFLIMYTYSENYILPLSHDEVVHGKKSMLSKMFGSYEQKFATLRAFYGFMTALPGKKLLFMGGEFGQFIEWKYDSGLDWLLLGYDSHKQLIYYVRNLNHVYLNNPCLWQLDHERSGFEWLQVDDADNSVISFVRKGRLKGEYVIVVSNFTPVPRRQYRIHVPESGMYYQVINSDDVKYGGGTDHLPDYASIKEKGKREEEQVIYIDLSPLSTIYLRNRREKPNKEKSKNQKRGLVNG